MPEMVVLGLQLLQMHPDWNMHFCGGCETHPEDLAAAAAALVVVHAGTPWLRLPLALEWQRQQLPQK
jgi:hypothetical protein